VNYLVKKLSRNTLIYSFSPNLRPAEVADPEDIVIFETIDALGGQVRSEDVSLSEIDWGKINPATGPLYIEGAEPGDTLVVDILDIKVEDKAVIIVVPKYGALHEDVFSAKVKLLDVNKDFVKFNNIKIPAKPMIGVIGVAPEKGEIPTGTSGPHGGNMNVAEVTRGRRLYFPVFTEGALLAVGDLHVVQGDGEVCVAAAEVSGEVTVRVDVIKEKHPPYPVLEAEGYYAILASGKTLDEAARAATKAAVEALMREYNYSFEEAYMLASLVVHLRINQVVDPMKGIRAEIPKSIVTLNSLLTPNY